MLNAGLMSSERGDWLTPDAVLDPIREFAGPPGIGLDPCGNPYTIVGARNEYRIDHGEDGLIRPWDDRGLVFVNPPYGRGIADWIRAMVFNAAKGVEIIALVPSRTDSAWFHLCLEAQAICFWRGRIRFSDGANTAPFPSALIYWGKRKHRFADVFTQHGVVLLP